MLQCVAVCCSVLRYFCRVLQCVAVCCSVLQCECSNRGTPAPQKAISSRVPVHNGVALCCCVLQCVVTCSSALKRVAVRCSVLQRVAVCVHTREAPARLKVISSLAPTHDG